MKARKQAVIGAVLVVAIVVLSAAPSSALEIKRMKLSDGATLLVSEQHQLPMVSVAIAFDAGSRRDPKGKEGLAVLTAASLTEGTKTLSAAEFNQKVDFMGSAISVDGGRDYSTVESISKLTPADVRSFYRNYYKMGSAIIAVTGDVDADQIKAKLEKEFAGLKGAVPPQPAPPAPTVAPGIHLKVIDRDVTQANLILGSGGIARSNPDFYRLEVMDYILGGGGFASRLIKTVRSKAGLAYTVTSFFQTGLFPGSFEVVFQTKNSSADEAVRMILDQVREIQQQPVSDAELDSAKKAIIGSFPLRLDRQSQIVSFMLQIEIFGLGTDYAEQFPKLIGAVNKDDVQKVAQKYMNPGALLVVAVADQHAAKLSVASFEPPKQTSAATP
jgi:predicted Zn-dependent peptidase